VNEWIEKVFLSRGTHGVHPRETGRGLTLYSEGTITLPLLILRAKRSITGAISPGVPNAV
jgi:hypothetical protein